MFTKIVEPKPVRSAHLCSKKFESVRYYTNLWGDKFADTSVEMRPVTSDGCRDYLKFKSCDEGSLIRNNNNLFTTNKALKVDFPGAIIGFLRAHNTTRLPIACWRRLQPSIGRTRLRCSTHYMICLIVSIRKETVVSITWQWSGFQSAKGVRNATTTKLEKLTVLTPEMPFCQTTDNTKSHCRWLSPRIPQLFWAARGCIS